MKLEYEDAKKMQQKSDSEPDNGSNYSVTKFDDEFENILTRIIEQLTIKMEKSGKKKKNIFEKGVSEIPISEDTWHKYTQRKVSNIKLQTFYEICQYTNVSADYLLCFNDVTSKKASATQIQMDYGLTPEALDSLEEIHRRTNIFTKFALGNNKEYMLEYDFMNFWLTNFAPRFLVSIFHYFSALDEFEDFERQHFNNGKIRKKFLSSEEQRIVNEYEDLENKVDIEKYRLTQLVYRTVESYRKYLKMETHTKQ